MVWVATQEFPYVKVFGYILQPDLWAVHFKTSQPVSKWVDLTCDHWKVSRETTRFETAQQMVDPLQNSSAAPTLRRLQKPWTRCSFSSWCLQGSTGKEMCWTSRSHSPSCTSSWSVSKACGNGEVRHQDTHFHSPVSKPWHVHVVQSPDRFENGCLISKRVKSHEPGRNIYIVHTHNDIQIKHCDRCNQSVMQTQAQELTPVPVKETGVGASYLVSVQWFFSCFSESHRYISNHDLLLQKSAECMTQALYSVYCCHGAPDEMISDPGREFVKQVYA